MDWRRCPMFKWLLVPYLLLMAARAFAGPPIDAYGRLPSIEHVALSPDGSMIAYVQSTESRHVLAIADIGASRLIAMTQIGTGMLRSVDWADDDHLLVTSASSVMPFELSGERTEWHLMSVYNLKTRKWSALLDNVRGGPPTMNVVVGRPVVYHKGGDTLLCVEGVYVEQRTDLALFRINLTTGAETLVRQGVDATNEWVVDDSGDVVAEQGYVEHDRRWTIRLLDGNHTLSTVAGIAPIDAPSILGLSARGDALIVALTEPEGVVWKPLSIKDGVWGPEIAAGETLTDVIRTQGSQRILGTGFVGDTTRYRFTDPVLQTGWDWTVRVFNFQRAEFISTSADHTKIIVRIMGPKSGYGYFMADTREHFTLPIGKVFADVSEFAEVRPIVYPAGDGLRIPAYLTLPADRAAKDLPVIVLPHGGPQARDLLEFDWWAQALASQGYAVLQPNYRGSELGTQWVAAGYGEWGRKMQTDLSDGLQYLAAQGVVDAKRACIVGASYGGYAALAGVSIQSGVYRCAVAVAPVADPANFMRWVLRKEAIGQKTGLRYWQRFLGVEDVGDKRLDAISPMKHAADITVPLMLIHGKDDTTVPYEQSVDLAKAMRRTGTVVEFVTLDKEDHYLSRSETRLQMLRTSVEFLRKYNPPD